MSNRVTKSSKDSDGDIIGLCGPTWKVSKSEAIRDIHRDPHYYDVSPGVYVRVVTRGGQQYLTTDPDGSSSNNLDNLPDC